MLTIFYIPKNMPLDHFSLIELTTLFVVF